MLWENNAASLEKGGKKNKRRDSEVNIGGQRGVRAFCSGFVC